jgi:hypothetical protein
MKVNYLLYFCTDKKEKKIFLRKFRWERLQSQGRAS